jgi:hypothetical protein
MQVYTLTADNGATFVSQANKKRFKPASHINVNIRSFVLFLTLWSLCASIYIEIMNDTNDNISLVGAVTETGFASTVALPNYDQIHGITCEFQEGYPFPAPNYSPATK